MWGNLVGGQVLHLGTGEHWGTWWELVEAETQNKEKYIVEMYKENNPGDDKNNRGAPDDIEKDGTNEK